MISEYKDMEGKKSYELLYSICVLCMHKHWHIFNFHFSSSYIYVFFHLFKDGGPSLSQFPSSIFPGMLFRLFLDNICAIAVAFSRLFGVLEHFFDWTT
jgi:hypothetical protein